MKRTTTLFCFLTLAAFDLYPQQTDFPVLTGPYLGQKPPGLTPEIFAPGIVSLPATREWSSSLSPDGKEFYFYRITQVSDKFRMNIYSSKLVDGAWTAPEEASFAKGFPASQPHVTRDNKTLYFGWHRPVPAGEQSYMGDIGIWATERTSNGWSEPHYAGQGMFVSSDRDGRIYTTDMSARNVNGRTHLAQVELKDGRFAAFKRLALDPRFDGPAHPCIALDGSYVLFDVEGGSQLHVSFKQKNGTWGEAIDLANHGFDKAAGGATITPDGKYLFFHLRGDLWWVDIKAIENLKRAAAK